MLIRTSLLLPVNLHQRLLIAAKEKNKTLSSFLRDTLNEVLTVDEEARIKHMYQTLRKLEGLGERGITDASITINETLYGEHGAWKENGE